MIGLLVPLLLAGCSDDEPAAAPTATQGVDPAGPAPATETASPSVAVTTAPPVKIGSTAELIDDVTVRVGKVRAITVKADQPGQIAGSAVSVEIAVKNASTKPFDVANLVVNAAYGDGTPAEETAASPSQPLTGDVPAGESVTGTYVYRVPKGQTSDLSIEVDSDQSPVTVTFES